MGCQMTRIFPWHSNEPGTKQVKWRYLTMSFTVPKTCIVDNNEFVAEQKRNTNRSPRLFHAQSSVRAESRSDSILLEAPGFLIELPVTVEVEKRADPEASSRYRLGFVQGIPTFSSIHTYFDKTNDFTGRAKWELNDNECVDCDGSQRSTPFYGAKSFVEFGSLKQKTSFSLYMDDVPFTRASWALNLKEVGYPGSHVLRDVERKQKFVVWLVVQDLSDGAYEVLLAVERDLQFYVSIDNPLLKQNQAVGIRSSCSAKCEIFTNKSFIPRLPAAFSIEKSFATANEAMRFYWYGKSESEKVLVPGVVVNPA